MKPCIKIARDINQLRAQLNHMARIDYGMPSTALQVKMGSMLRDLNELERKNGDTISAWNGWRLNTTAMGE